MTLLSYHFHCLTVNSAVIMAVTHEATKYVADDMLLVF